MLEIVDITTPLIGPASLSIGSGECVAILGPSGSGKSLLLRAIVDLDPNQGAVRLGDLRREHMPAHEWRRLVAMVPSETGWWADNVADHFETAGEALPWLEALGLPNALGWEVGRLSTGEKQRLAIARSLVRKPRAMLLDEPTSALDSAATKRVERLILDQCKQGMIVVVVSHDRDQAKRLASRVCVMDSGVLHGIGDVGS